MPRRHAQRCEMDPDRLSTRLDLSFPGRLEAIPPIVDRIMGVVREEGCAAGSEFEIEVALDEALANAVKHGCRFNAEKSIHVSVLCEADRGLLLIVRDPGDGFELTAIPSPVVGERVFASHGRGIFLINRLMDEVHYTKGGTEIWMRKSRRPSRSPARRRETSRRG